MTVHAFLSCRLFQLQSGRNDSPSLRPPILVQFDLRHEAQTLGYGWLIRFAGGADAFGGRAAGRALSV